MFLLFCLRGGVPYSNLYPVFVTEVRAIYRRTLAKTALDAARMVGRLAACAGP